MAAKIIKLTPEQENCVNFRPDGELLVRGIPGAGKTTVVIERALFLKKNEDHVENDSKVLVLTYNKALATYITQMARSSQEEPVKAMTFHQWGSSLIKESGISNYRITDDKLRYVKWAKNTVKKYGALDLPRIQASRQGEERALLTFLSEEIAWIKNNAIGSRSEYLNVQRTGRGTQVQINKNHRESIYDIYEKYNELMKSERYIDFEDVALLIIKNSNDINADKKASHILVDEAQDLTPAQFRVIKFMAAKSLTIAADKGQQIYRRNFTWKSVGIEIRGARSRLLGITHRSTKQIIQLARSLQLHDKQLLADEDFLPAQDPENDGPKPELFISDQMKNELNIVVRKVKQLRSAYPDDSIAIIAHSLQRLTEFEEQLEQNGIGSIHIKSEEADFLVPGVKLVTFQSSKGLEFEHVIVTGLQDGKIPFGIMDPGDDPEAFKATERKKLYVAMTRARLTLTLSGVTPLSPFINELDSNLYQ